MVETKGLYRTGVKSCAIDDDDDDAIMVGVDEGWRLICAPPATVTLSYSLLLWEPTHQDDRTPTLDKVVRRCLAAFYLEFNGIQVAVCIHGAAKRSPLLMDPNSNYIRLQCSASVHNLQ